MTNFVAALVDKSPAPHSLLQLSPHFVLTDLVQLGKAIVEHHMSPQVFHINCAHIVLALFTFAGHFQGLFDLGQIPPVPFLFINTFLTLF